MPTKRWFSYINQTVIGLALLHGLLYASVLPPWGLIDEAQHVHYIQYVAENGYAPIPNQTLISTPIIDSLFATQHWKTFHWPTPAGRKVDELGAVAYSYEAYHPPLFYWLFAPLTWIMPTNVLQQQFLLRWATVLLSLLSVWFLQRTVRLVFADSRWQILVPLLLVALPERTFAVSRVNNDGLLEVVSALFIFFCTDSLIQTFALSRVLLGALIIGIGIWVKLSMSVMILPYALLLWLQRGSKGWGRGVVWSALLLGGIGGGLLLRNLWRFGEATGYNTFHQLYPLPIPSFTLENLLATSTALFQHTWVIWWKGSEVGSNWLLTVIYILLTIISLGSLVGIARTLFSPIAARTFSKNWPSAQALSAKKSEDKVVIEKESQKQRIILFYSSILVVYIGLSLVSYFRGIVPVVQGRFLLPAVLPFVLLIAWGWQNFRFGRQLLFGLICVLFMLDALSVGGNLLPYFYYWSDVAQGTLSPTTAISEKFLHFYHQWIADKPAFIVATVPWITVAYLLLLGFILRSLYVYTQRNRLSN